jgi:hypothetical protein
MALIFYWKYFEMQSKYMETGFQKKQYIFFKISEV